MTIRVLVVDDSIMVRELLSKGLSLDAGIDVVGTAANPYEARDRIAELKPDVMTLDVEMPRMNGIDFLRRLMPQQPMPVIMLSTLTARSADVTMAALDAGAVDFVAKPSSFGGTSLSTLILTLRAKIKSASMIRPEHLRRTGAQVRHIVDAQCPPLRASPAELVVAIGASTGGTDAVRDVLLGLPINCPGVVVAQHMPPVFTRLYAERINSICALTVSEAMDGERVTPGSALIAPGGRQMRLERSGGMLTVRLGENEKVSGHSPSVDVLFESVARHARGRAVGVILTGMGRDGAAGLRKMRDAGAMTFGQDQASSVVYGMPRAAMEDGAVVHECALSDIASKIVRQLSKTAAA
ncbi:MAG: two-component system chemotaxis response regulator CheB [Polyangiales bacterium]|jgi:two-component system chemotaxis response regulator CheB